MCHKLETDLEEPLLRLLHVVVVGVVLLHLALHGPHHRLAVGSEGCQFCFNVREVCVHTLILSLEQKLINNLSPESLVLNLGK